MRYGASVVLVLGFLTGCSSYYTPPGRGADMQKLVQGEDASVAAAMNRQPAAQFPAGVAVVRVQQSGYCSSTAQSWGTGAYSVVTTRDVESPEQMDRLTKLPGVHGIVPLNRLLLSRDLQNDVQLRQAAGRTHADMLVIYTLDTTFTTEDKLAPLSIVTLGLSPNIVARVLCTASAVILDTRTGYVYGAGEATEQQGQLASAWTSESAVDDARRRAESKAFEKLVGELETTWTGVYQTYGKPAVSRAVLPEPERTAVRRGESGSWRFVEE